MFLILVVGLSNGLPIVHCTGFMYLFFFYLFIFFIYEYTNLFDFALSYCTLFARKKASYIVVLRCCATAVHKTFITVIGN